MKRASSLPGLNSAADALLGAMLHGGDVVPIDEIIEEIVRPRAGKLPDLSLFVQMRKLLQTKEDFDPESDVLVFPYPSFEIRDGQLIRFDRADDAYKALRRWLESDSETDSDSGTASHAYVRIFVDHSSGVNVGQRRAIEKLGSLFTAFFLMQEHTSMVGRAAKTYLSEADAGTTDVEDLSEILEKIAARSDVSIAQLVGETPKPIVSYGAFPDDLLFDESFAKQHRHASHSWRSVHAFVRIGANRYYFCVVGLRQLNNGRQFGTVALARKGGRLPKHACVFVEDLVESRCTAKVQYSQTAVLDQLMAFRSKYSRQIITGLIPDRKTRSSRLREQLGKFCRQLAAATRAHSCTIRLYSGSSAALRVFAWYSGVSESGTRPPDIEVSDVAISLNAAVFHIRRPTQPAFINFLDEPDRAIIPADLAAVGLRHPLRTTHASKSEICASIWHGDLPIGTLNLESPSNRGFQFSEVFVSTVAQTLGELFVARGTTQSIPTVMRMADAIGDAHSLTRVDIPSLRKEVGSLDSLPRLTDTIERLEEFQRKFRADESEGLDLERSSRWLERTLRRKYENLLQGERANESTRGWRFAAGTLHSAVGEALIRITDHVLSNSRTHSQLHKDFLHVELSVTPHVPNHAVFRLRYESRTAMAVSPQLLQAFGLHPIVRQGELHFGAFLMSLQVHELGGVLSVDDSTATSDLPSSLRFGITIPIRLNEGASSPRQLT